MATTGNQSSKDGQKRPASGSPVGKNGGDILRGNNPQTPDVNTTRGVDGDER